MRATILTDITVGALFTLNNFFGLTTLDDTGVATPEFILMYFGVS